MVLPMAGVRGEPPGVDELAQLLPAGPIVVVIPHDAAAEPLPLFDAMQHPALGFASSVAARAAGPGLFSVSYQRGFHAGIVGTETPRETAEAAARELLWRISWIRVEGRDGEALRVVLLGEARSDVDISPGALYSSALLFLVADPGSGLLMYSTSHLGWAGMAGHQLEQTMLNIEPSYEPAAATAHHALLGGIVPQPGTVAFALDFPAALRTALLRGRPPSERRIPSELLAAGTLKLGTEHVELSARLVPADGGDLAIGVFGRPGRHKLLAAMPPGRPAVVSLRFGSLEQLYARWLEFLRESAFRGDDILLRASEEELDARLGFSLRGDLLPLLGNEALLLAGDAPGHWVLAIEATDSSRAGELLVTAFTALGAIVHQTGVGVHSASWPGTPGGLYFQSSPRALFFSSNATALAGAMGGEASAAHASPSPPEWFIAEDDAPPLLLRATPPVIAAVLGYFDVRTGQGAFDLYAAAQPEEEGIVLRAWIPAGIAQIAQFLSPAAQETAD